MVPFSKTKPRVFFLEPPIKGPETLVVPSAHEGIRGTIKE